MYTIVLMLAASIWQAHTVPGPISIPKIDLGTLSFANPVQVNLAKPSVDWTKAGLPISVFRSEGVFLPAADFSAKARLGWTGQGLIAHVDVTAPHRSESQDVEQLYRGDSVEFFLRKPGQAEEMFQFVVSPGGNPDFPTARTHFFDYRASSVRDKVPPAAYVSTSNSTSGYEMTIVLPWSLLEVAPSYGDTFGARIAVNHQEPGHPFSKLTWTGNDSASEFWKPPVVRLDKVAGRLDPIVGWVEWNSDLLAGTAILMGEPSLAGQVAHVKYSNLFESQQTLKADGDRTIASFQIPGPAPGDGPPLLDVTVGGQLLNVSVPDIRPLRIERFLAGANGGASRWMDPRLIPSPRAAVFSAVEFPPVLYPDLPYAERLVGPIKIQTRYFDRKYTEVSRADLPGRYLAKVDVSSPAASYTTYRTLFRKPADWRGSEMDAVVAAAEFERLLTPERRPDAASKAEQDTIHGLRKHLGNAVKYEYELKVPSDYEASSGRRWPLIVYLHGSGGGTDQAWPNVKRGEGPMGPAHHEDKFPFIVVALRSPGGWFPPAVEDVIDEVEAKYAVDRSRIYLTGFSMGGFGTWRTAYDQPDRFAAIAPVAAGAGSRELMPLIKQLPAWVFNGGADSTTSPTLARSAVEVLKRAGGTVRYTEYPGQGHVDALRLAYAEKELYDWFLRFQRK